jgi:hypothetical protein
MSAVRPTAAARRLTLVITESETPSPKKGRKETAMSSTLSHVRTGYQTVIALVMSVVAIVAAVAAFTVASNATASHTPATQHAPLVVHRDGCVYMETFKRC